MKTKWIGGLLLVVLFCVALWGGYKYWTSDDYVYALPANPKALAVVDLLQLSKESDVELDELKHSLWKDGDIEGLGVDWSKKAYAFVSSNEYFGVLLPVKDKDKVVRFLQEASEQGKCSALETNRGFQWAVWDSKWMIGFDDKALMALGPGLDADMDVLRQKILTCFRQGKAAGGVSSTLFRDLKTTEDVAFRVVFRMDILPSFYGDDFMTGLPNHASLSDLNLKADVRLTRQGISLAAEILSDNAEILEYYKQLALLGGYLDGEYAQYVPSDAWAWCGLNVNGEVLLEQLRRNPMVRTFLLGLNMGIDADLMIRSMKGEMAFTLNAPKPTGKQDYLLTARLARQDFLKEADYWKRKASANPILTFRDFGKNRFYIAMEGLETYFGVKDETLYVTSDGEGVEDICRMKTETLSAWEKEIRESRFFLWLNLDMLQQRFMQQTGKGHAVWTDKLEMFDEVVLRSSAVRHLTLDVRTSKDVNVLEELLN